MCDDKSEKLENFLSEAKIVANYLMRKINEKSITTHIEKSMTEKYIKSLQDFLEERSNENN